MMRKVFLSLTLIFLSAALLSATAKLTKIKNIGKAPNFMVLSRDGKMLYLTIYSSEELVAIDTADGRLLKRAYVGDTPLALTLSPEGDRAFVGNKTVGLVSVVDLKDLRV